MALERLPCPPTGGVLWSSLTASVESGRPRSSSKAIAEDGGGVGWGKLDHHCLVGPFDAQNDQRPQAPGKATHSQVYTKADVSVHLCISLRHGQPHLAPWGLSSRLLQGLGTPVNKRLMGAPAYSLPFMRCRVGTQTEAQVP